VKANVDADAGTATVGGTVADGSLELSDSVHPPAGAGADRVPLHWIGAAPVATDGEQVTSDTTGYAITVTDAVWLTPPYDAVIVTVDVGGASIVVIGNVCVVAPAGTVTVAGTDASAPLLASCTTAPLGGAATDIVRIAGSVMPPGTDGTPISRLWIVSRAIVSTVDRETPEYVAVIVACVAAESAVSISKVCVVAPAAIVTDGGTVAFALLLDSATTLPCGGAGSESVTIPTTALPPTTEAGEVVTV